MGALCSKPKGDAGLRPEEIPLQLVRNVKTDNDIGQKKQVKFADPIEVIKMIDHQ